jgi:hypothetical protein
MSCHCERMAVIASEARQSMTSGLHGLPRFARSDANKTVLATNVVMRQSVCSIDRIRLARNDER